MPREKAALFVHGTCVAIGRRAVLLRGKSGAGKSDLALRLIASERGAALVADDQVELRVARKRLIARSPRTIRGRMEVRGVGIVKVRNKREAELVLLVDLVAREEVPRLPPQPPRTEDIAGVAVPVLALHAFDASAPAKLRLAVKGRI